MKGNGAYVILAAYSNLLMPRHIGKVMPTEVLLVVVPGLIGLVYMRKKYLAQRVFCAQKIVEDFLAAKPLRKSWVKIGGEAFRLRQPSGEAP